MKPHRGQHIAASLLALLFIASSLISLSATTKATASSSSTATNEQLKKANNIQPHLTSSSSAHESSSSPIKTSSSSSSSSSSSEAINRNVQDRSASVERSQSSSGAGDLAPAAVTDKKQDSEAYDLFNTEEYVQIKPEEVLENLKDLESQTAIDKPDQPLSAEHKSVEDELNAQLAQDSIGQLESIHHSYAVSAATAAAAPIGGGAQHHLKPFAPHHGGHHQSSSHLAAAASARAAFYKPLLAHAPAFMSERLRAPRMLPAAQHMMAARQPPSYTAMKGKLTGVNTIATQYPHPAPGYPHQMPRQLPRGAAAGYAAFRNFIRAHASKYKMPIPSVPQASGSYSQGGSSSPSTYDGPGAGAGQPYSSASGAQVGGIPLLNYHELSSLHEYMSPPATVAPATMTPPVNTQPPAQYPGAAAAGQGGYGAGSTKSNTKVAVAQAYIPHASSSSYQQQQPGDGYGKQQQQSMVPYSNQVLDKLYGDHAPQGIGKPEYSKDYGMIIHYPQATVFAEPMTMEQLHKLAGGSISHVIEQLQHNLAHGHPNESNTLRANNKHHLGNGVTIHAKEYYAPGKGGQSVPTTAAIISTSSSSSNNGGESSQYESPITYQMVDGQTSGDSYQLGSGYNRVKQAVASSQAKYNNNNYGSGSNSVNSKGGYGSPASSGDYQQQSTGSYMMMQQHGGGGNKYNKGEPLSAITSFLGSPKFHESLYKANAALGRHIEPEIHAQIQQFAKSALAKRPLRYTEHDVKSPLILRGLPSFMQSGIFSGKRYPGSMPMQMPQHGYRPHGGAHHGGRGARGPRKGGQQQGYRPRPQHQSAGAYRQQQQQHSAAYEQEVNQQLSNFLNDFHAGDDQYNGKAPIQMLNQGYPGKVMQKYQQPQQGGGYKNQQQQVDNTHHEGIEIPQGPNDQIGEISELIEALKGTLDLHKPSGQASEGTYGQPKQQTGKLDDVRYLANALGQAPSYAMEVPVNDNDCNTDKKNAADSSYQQRPQQQQQQHESAYQAPAQVYNQQLPMKQHQAQPTASYQQQSQQVSQNAYAQQPAAASYGEGQQQQQYQAGHALNSQPEMSYAPQPSGYGAQPQQYQQQPQQQYQAPAQQHQQHADYRRPQPAQQEYQQAQQHQEGPQQHHHHQQQQQQQQQPIQADYASAAMVAANGYGQPAPTPIAQPVAAYQPPPPVDQSNQSTSYSNSEHTQVINHIVPVTSQSGSLHQPATAQTSGGYSESQAAANGDHHPGNQIVIAAPEASQHQQAHSLSSFIESLPTDTQELLRQPALLDEHNSHNTPHIAALDQADAAYSSTTQQPQQAQANQAPTYESTPQKQANHYHHHEQQSAQSHEQQSAQSHESQRETTYQKQQQSDSQHSTSGRAVGHHQQQPKQQQQQQDYGTVKK